MEDYIWNTNNDDEYGMSTLVFVDRYGELRFTWDLINEIEGIFDWDGNLDFFIKYNDGQRQ